MRMEKHRHDSQSVGVLIYRALKSIRRSPVAKVTAATVVDRNRESIPNAESGGFFKEFTLQFGSSSRSEPKTPPKGSSVANGLADHGIEALVVAPQIMGYPGLRIGRD